MQRPLALVLLCCFLAGDFRVSAQSGGSCSTPNGEAAKCVSIFSCKILYDAVSSADSEVRRFLRASQCGYDDTPLVCCGSSSSYTKKKPDTAVTNRASLQNLNDHRNAYLLPGRSLCGYQAFQDKVLNGQATYINEFPWMVLLRYQNSTGYEQFSCGGTLINERYVLTAAHCVVGKIRKRVGVLRSIRLGEWNIDTDPDCINSAGYQLCTDKPVNVQPEVITPHEQYNDDSIDRYNDIALVRLNRAVKYTEYIRPVCLPISSQEKTRVGENLTVVGWGKTESLKYSPTKQKLQLPLVDQSECNGKFRTFSVNLDNSQLCAGGIKDEDSCSGDSGGPLLKTARNDSSQFYIEGIVSFGAACGSDGLPGIYTRVSEYLGWILDNMKP